MHVYTLENVAVTTAANIATATEIPWGDHSGGTVFIPAGETVAALTYYGSYKKGGTFFPLYEGGVQLTEPLVAAGNAYVLPTGLASIRALKIIGDVAATVHLSYKDF